MDSVDPCAYLLKVETDDGGPFQRCRDGNAHAGPRKCCDSLLSCQIVDHLRYAGLDTLTASSSSRGLKMISSNAAAHQATSVVFTVMLTLPRAPQSFSVV